MQERIGDIRILDNYSFVQVMSEDADTIIQKLNEFPYRGRNLLVSYSRKLENDDSVESGIHSSAEVGGNEQ